MHLRDYFDKEMKHVELQLDALLRSSVDDPSIVPKASLLNPIPKVKGEKLKSIGSILKTIGNAKFIAAMLSVSTDACIRYVESCSTWAVSSSSGAQDGIYWIWGQTSAGVSEDAICYAYPLFLRLRMPPCASVIDYNANEAARKQADEQFHSTPYRSYDSFDFHLGRSG
jgi:hypothetical protein